MLSEGSSSLAVPGKQGLRWLRKDSLTGWEEGWTGVPPQCPLTPRLHNSSHPPGSGAKAALLGAFHSCLCLGPGCNEQSEEKRLPV